MQGEKLSGSYQAAPRWRRSWPKPLMHPPSQPCSTASLLREVNALESGRGQSDPTNKLQAALLAAKFNSATTTPPSVQRVKVSGPALLLL